MAKESNVEQKNEPESTLNLEDLRGGKKKTQTNPSLSRFTS